MQIKYALSLLLCLSLALPPRSWSNENQESATTKNDTELSKKTEAPIDVVKLRKSHKFYGHMTAGMLGVQIGTGIAAGMTDSRDWQTIHAISGLILLGLGLQRLDQAPEMTKAFGERSKHQNWAYTYLALLAATTLVGFISINTDAEDKRNTLKRVHTGLGTGMLAAFSFTFFSF